MVTTPLAKLLYSRKFLLAGAGVISTLVLHYFQIDPEVWLAIDGLIAIVIAGIAHEDAAEKSAPQTIAAGTIESGGVQVGDTVVTDKAAKARSA